MAQQSQQRPQPVARTLIVRLGKTGLSCARYLTARGVQVAVTDTRAAPPGLDELRRELPDVAVFPGGFDAAVFAVAERLVVTLHTVRSHVIHAYSKLQAHNRTEALAAARRAYSSPVKVGFVCA